MATHNYTTNDQAVVDLGNRVHKVEKLIDLGDFDVNSGDTLQCIKLPKGAVLHQGGAIVSTPDTNAVDATVKVGSTAITGALNADSAANTAVHKTDAVLTTGSLLITADDTLDILIETADSAGDGVILTYAEYGMLEAISNSEV